jgi:hypothetical protein
VSSDCLFIQSPITYFLPESVLLRSLMPFLDPNGLITASESHVIHANDHGDINVQDSEIILVYLSQLSDFIYACTHLTESIHKRRGSDVLSLLYSAQLSYLGTLDVAFMPTRQRGLHLHTYPPHH